MFNLNSELFKELPRECAMVQRGLYYGDSLFESLRVFNGRIPLMEQHWGRLSAGLVLMGYDVPAHWSSAYFAGEILRMSPLQARARLTVWRSPGGLYAPDDDRPQFLIETKALASEEYEWLSEGLKVGLCETVRLPVDQFSGLKTLNAARYVAAAREARSRGWDDAVLLNTGDRICEATGSNVFWFNDQSLCTPPLADGCVTGVMRELLLTLTNAAGYAVKEKSATFADLLNAREVFLSNAVRGIRRVREIEGVVFESEKTKILHELLVASMRT
ncbi:MAG: aminotransferase class IV family protein [Saprospiraceae bacterium]|nr:aminotransferase class IV family protein [Saprospiraceae bacterium]